LKMKSGMARKKWWIATVALITVAIAVQYVTARRYAADVVSLPERSSAKPAQMCPWRNPDRDRRILFPQATRHQARTAILTHLFAQLKEQLGRWPTADDNPLYVYDVFDGSKPVGSIAARRVKGQYGALEIVVGVDTQGAVRGVLIQRSRETAEIEAALLKSGWLNTLRGKTAQSDWSLKRQLANVPPVARPSAQAVVEGVRSLLVLINAATQATATSDRKHH
jgi:Na+-translocating ferredoxin:NAD+ oxidoreductase RnfG subunit